MRTRRSVIVLGIVLGAMSLGAQQVPMPDSTHKQPMPHAMTCSDSAGHKMGDCPMMKGGAGMPMGDHAMMMQHMKGMMPPPPSGSPIFDALGMQVAMLDADSTTDWSKVNLEELRQHLIDMNDVMMNAKAVQKPVDGGVTMTITGTGRTVAAIQRMVVNHMNMLQTSGKYVTKVTKTKDGVTATVTAPAPASEKAVARIRGLGFAGLMTEGTHHMRHHGNMARGDSMPHMH